MIAIQHFQCSDQSVIVNVGASKFSIAIEMSAAEYFCSISLADHLRAPLAGKTFLKLTLSMTSARAKQAMRQLILVCQMDSGLYA